MHKSVSDYIKWDQYSLNFIEDLCQVSRSILLKKGNEKLFDVLRAKDRWGKRVSFPRFTRGSLDVITGSHSSSLSRSHQQQFFDVIGDVSRFLLLSFGEENERGVWGFDK